MRTHYSNINSNLNKLKNRPITTKKRELERASEKKRTQCRKRAWDIGYWTGITDASASEEDKTVSGEKNNRE